MMLGKIIRINDVNSIMDTHHIKYIQADMEGYIIETDICTFKVLIDNYAQCCEDFGHVSSEDDLDYYINSELLKVSITDTALNKKILTKTGNEDDLNNYTEIQFVDFVTNRGTFQLAVYNSSNGYYGHGIKIIKDDEILLDSGL